MRTLKRIPAALSMPVACPRGTAASIAPAKVALPATKNFLLVIPPNSVMGPSSYHLRVSAREFRDLKRGGIVVHLKPVVTVPVRLIEHSSASP